MELKQEKIGLAMLLAWVAGFVDAGGYLTLAHVFTSHMSGNTVAMGAHLGNGQWTQVIRRAVPIAWFIFGVFLGAAFGIVAERAGFRSRFSPAFVFAPGKP